MGKILLKEMKQLVKMELWEQTVSCKLLSWESQMRNVDKEPEKWVVDQK